MDMNRRQFFKACAAGLGGSSLALLGFSPQPVLAETRNFKLARTTETRNTCPYCSVGCGILMYSLGDKAKNAQSEIIHIEGDPDHPVNRGTLCPKGAGLLDFVHSPNRLKYPEYRAPAANEWTRISWDDAIDQDREADEGRPRRELRCQDGRWQDGQPLAHDRDFSPRPRRRTKPATSRTRWCAAWGCSYSIIRRVSDTARRWPVWPRRLAAVR